MSDSVNHNSGHVCEDYRRELHLAISECSKEIGRALNRAATALSLGRHKDIEKLVLYGEPIKLEDIKWASDVISKFFDTYHSPQNLFEKNDSEIKKAIEELETPLEIVQKRLKGIRVLERPSKVVEWMKKSG